MEVQEVEVIALACGAQNSQYISEAPMAPSLRHENPSPMHKPRTYKHNGADVGAIVRAKDNIVYWLPHANLGRFLAPPACSP